MKFLYYGFLTLASLGLFGLIAGILGVAFIINYYGQDLPDYSQLKDHKPPVVTRIYAGDGRLMEEYAQQKRIFIPIEAIPDHVIYAFISAEDQNFFTHKGVDGFAILRAAIRNLQNIGSGRRPEGASTITQQVAKNFLLTNEVSFERKIKEAILAMRIEKAMSKERLLELYLNEIFLGARSYGVAAAALNYFNKSLEELTLAESAYLAALPKAPNNYHPVRQKERATDRRNWVLSRMEEDGHITKEEAEEAKQTELLTQDRDDTDIVNASYFAEEVRRELEEEFGNEGLYGGGLAVRTTVDPQLQKIAVESLWDGLMAYDKRHGWRGPLKNFENLSDWAKKLEEFGRPKAALESWRLAVVIEAGAQEAEIAFIDKSRDKLKLDGVKWARKCIHDCYGLGPEIQKVTDVVKTGDVILVEKIEENYVLRQIPVIQGAIIVLDPHTGRVLAMQGGWKHDASSFNRVTQAKRQPGSAFKPFVYLPALDQGFTPATLVLDAPFVIEQAPGDYWRPTNYSNEFYGPTPIRVGIEKSRNLMTVRLADHIGMDQLIKYAKRFGIAENMEPFLSYALGAGETTLLRLTSAYAMLANGGKQITPTFIDRIQDRRGKTIFSHDERPCPNCGNLIRWDGQGTPLIPDDRAQIADPRTTYQIVSIMEGVVQRGTAQRLKSLGHPVAGKTGTTNESKDTWFIGFTPNLVVGVFVGFDDPKSMGKRETGSAVAAPIFKDFMEGALEDVSPVPFRVPSGVRHVRVNAKTGRVARPGDEDVIWEAFVTGTEPNVNDYVLDTQVISGNMDDPFGYSQFGYEGYDGYGDQPYDPYNNPAYGNSWQSGQNPSGGYNSPYLPQPRQQSPSSPGSGSNENAVTTGTGGLY